MPDLDGLLSALRESPEDGTARPPALEDAVLEDHLAVLSLVSRPDVPDALRIQVLDAVVPLLDGLDWVELARVAGGFRNSVLTHARSLLAELPSAEAAMVLAAIIEPRLGEEAAPSVALDALRQSPNGALVDGALPDDHAVRSAGLAAGLVALPASTLAELRDREALQQESVASLVVEEELQLLDDALRKRTSTTASEGERLLRLMLYRAVLVLGRPTAESSLAERAREWLFRAPAEELGNVRELAGHAAPAVLGEYLSRCLKRDQQRGPKLERTRLALSLVSSADEPERRRLRKDIAAALEHESDDVRADALIALASDGGALDAGLRETMAQVFGALPGVLQERAAPALAVLGAAGDLDNEAILQWAVSAPEDERQQRLDALLARWRASALDPELAGRFAAAAGRLIAAIPEDDRPPSTDAGVGVAMGWLRTQGTRVVEPLRHLSSWDGLTGAVLERVDLVARTLNAEPTRRVFVEVIRASEDRASAAATLAASSRDRGRLLHVVVPALQAVSQDDGGAAVLRAASIATTPRAQAMLLTSGLLVLQQLKQRSAELDAQSDDAEAAALRAKLDTISRALADAEHEARGNDALLEHFDALRQALQGMAGELEDAGVPAAAQAWRVDAAQRFAGLVSVTDDPRQKMRLAGDLSERMPEVINLLQELEQRAFNQRVVPEDGRLVARADLQSVSRSVAAAGKLEPGGPLEDFFTRPDIGQTLAAAWAVQRHEESTTGMETMLRALAAPKPDRAAIIRLDALTARPFDAGDLSRSIERFEEHERAAMVRSIGPVVSMRAREAGERARRAQGRDRDVMARVGERIDVPLQAIEGLLFGYFRFRKSLADAGWKTVEDRLGAELPRTKLDQDRHEVQGSHAAPTVLVRSTGVQVKGRVVRRAVVDGGPEPEGEST